MKEKIKRFLNQYKTYLLTVAILGVLLDVFVLVLVYDSIILFLVALWLLSAWFYQIKGELLVVWAIIFLILSPLFANMGKEAIADKMIIWFGVFLLLGALRELLGRKK